MNHADLIAQDQHHRQLALDINHSFIVQAPAGSGKTELLIQRFLVLLAKVKTPEEILAITFTKKAANEMRTRVIKALKSALDQAVPESAHAKLTSALAKKALAQDKQHHWNLIDNPNQLKIQTIDSLCTFITKQLPLLSQFGSQPDIADKPYDLYREAIQEVLLHLDENDAWTPSFSKLLLHVDNDLNKLQTLLISLLAKRDQWLPYIQLDHRNTSVKQQLERQLQIIISEALSKVKNAVPYACVAEILSIARFACGHLRTIQAGPEMLACEDLTNLPGTTPDQYSAWLGIAKLVLTKSFSWRKRVDNEIGFPPLKSLKTKPEFAIHQEYRQRFSALLATLSQDENLRLALSELFFLPAPTYTAAQWEILKALLDVLKVVAAQLRVTFQQHGQIDFIENMQAALTALGDEENPTDLALALDYQLQHILIDEFQDTSLTQYRLLEKLTRGWEAHDGRSVFIVGDPMQSIYRFREAEVGLFLGMRQNGIHAIQLLPLTLTVNFRSTPTIVDWNNHHFHALFPSCDDMASGAVSFSPSVSNQSKFVLTTGHSPCGQLKGRAAPLPLRNPIAKVSRQAAGNKFKEDGLDHFPTFPLESAVHVSGYVNANDAIEANNIVSLIQQLQEKHPQDTIAILVRSRSHLTSIVPELKKAKVPYQAIDIDLLASRQHIQDLVSLTCALLHPADRIAWLAVLRAPWCGLSLADLLVIAGNSPYATLQDQLQDQAVLKQLSDDGRQRVQGIYPILKAKMAARERHDFRSWIENTWLQLGGPAFLPDATDIEDAHAFFQLLEKLHEQSYGVRLEKLKEQTQQLFAAAKHEACSLQIMTIHSSKGLEFDTVILPQLNKKNPNDDKALLQWMERPLMNEQTGLLLAPISAIGNDIDPIYEYIHCQQQTRAAHETNRLFYVATTRAKKRLYLSFTINPKTDTVPDEYQPASGSFLEKIWPQWAKQKNETLRAYPVPGEANGPCFELPRSIQRIQSDWTNPINRPIITQKAIHHKPGGFHLAETAPKLIGVITHRILQHLSEKGMAWWCDQTDHDKQSYAEQALRQLGATIETISSAVACIVQIIQQVLTDTRGQWILYPHEQAKSEYAITAIIGQKPESYVIDRTFIDENDTRWIIDFKSSGLYTRSISFLGVKVFVEKEKEQYREQMQKYAAAFSLMEDRPIRLGLYFPALPTWTEWPAL